MTIWLLTIILIACQSKEAESIIVSKGTSETIVKTPAKKEAKPAKSLPNRYANKRFREVSVERIAENKFRVRGKGQIFEANFNWIVEDGHEELKSGFEMTDAGAPEWGKFDFVIDVQKKRETSTLTLILFESSAKDGSRQYELSIPLY